MEKQTTVGKEVSFSGIALHTGNDTTITFKPAPPNTGIRFVRTDLDNDPEIKAHVAKVVDVVRGTNIQQGEAKIYTVEHLLAAFYALNVDNVFVEMDANEPPVGDGSATHFVTMIEESGVIDQGVPRQTYFVTKPIVVSDNGSMIVALPSDKLVITCTIAFDHPEVFSQHNTFTINKDTFIKEIAPSRTFCFQHEVEQLITQGLIKGGSLDNAVVIGDEAVFSKESLRFKDEFVRHKILDLIGDLSLLGKTLHAHIIAIKPGHNLNIKLAEKLYQQNGAGSKTKRSVGLDEPTTEASEVDISEIMKILPHRYPFLLVDKIIEVGDNKITGFKNITINEPFFQGHFPGRPIMPGVLMIEAMAQVGGIMLLRKPENLGKYAYFMSINNVKFRQTVLPGDQLLMKAEVIKIRGKTGRVRGEAYVRGKLVAEGDITFALVSE